MTLRRLRLTISYDGTDFHGWQVQPGLVTIQGILEGILGGIEGAPVHVAGSGRTDAGVHALAQTAAVTLTNPIPAANLKKAVNRLLPVTIRVMDAVETHLDFHPRFDAVAKTYEYRLFRGEVCSPFDRRYMHHFPYPCDWARMAEFARLLEGKHDFSSFAAKDNRDNAGKSKVRDIYRSSMATEGDYVRYTVRGSGFLKHMVRNLVGTLLQAGKGNLDEAGLRGLLTGQEGRKGGPTAPAAGLCLLGVEYPPQPELGLHHRDEQQAEDDE